MFGFTAEITCLQADTGNCFVTITYFSFVDFVKIVGFDLIITVYIIMVVRGGCSCRVRAVGGNYLTNIMVAVSLTIVTDRQRSLSSSFSKILGM